MDRRAKTDAFAGGGAPGTRTTPSRAAPRSSASAHVRAADAFAPPRAAATTSATTSDPLSGSPAT